MLIFGFFLVFSPPPPPPINISTAASEPWYRLQAQRPRQALSCPPAVQTGAEQQRTPSLPLTAAPDPTAHSREGFSSGPTCAPAGLRTAYCGRSAARQRGDGERGAAALQPGPALAARPGSPPHRTRYAELPLTENNYQKETFKT